VTHRSFPSRSASSARRRSFMAQPFRHQVTGRYYIRRKVPAELRPALGHEFKRSLKTRDPVEAKARFAEQWSLSEVAFAQARAQAAGQDVLQPGDAEQLAARWFRAEQDRLWRTGAFVDMLAEERTLVTHDGQEHPVYTTLRDHTEHEPDAGVDWTSTVHANIERTMRQHSLPMPAMGTVAYSRLFAAFGDHIERLSQWALNCHEGKPDTHGATAAPVTLIHAELRASARAPAQLTPRARTLRALFDAYAEDKTLTDGDTRATRRSVSAYRAIVEGFIELQGELTASEVTRAVVAEYRAAVAKLPTRGDGIRSLTAPQLIEKAEREGLPRAAEATIRNRLRAVSAVLSYGVRLGWLQENPVIASGAGRAAAKAATRRQASQAKRNHYSPDELRTIFASPIYSHAGWTPPKADFGKAWHWMPLLLYYTGARREELAQLAVSDVRRDDVAGWHLDILVTSDDEGGARGVKTTGSRRLIPLHPDLIARGFIDYVRSVPAKGQVFPQLRPSPAGYFGSNFGKRWAIYLQQVVRLTSPARPSHGFRHTFKTLCRAAGIPEDVHDAITGHVGGSAVARGYEAMPLTRMAEEIKRFPAAPLR
jgi:integrase